MSKNQGGGNGKNPELRGGKNSLPKKTTGGVDLKAVAKNGANEAQKKWADKKVVADRPQTKHPKEWTKKIKSEVAKENTTKKAEQKKAITTKGVNKLKSKVTQKSNQKSTSTKQVSTPKKTESSKGVNKLQAKASKVIKPKSPPSKSSPIKKGPSKGR